MAKTTHFVPIRDGKADFSGRVGMFAEVTSAGTEHGRQSVAIESDMAKAEPSKASKPRFPSRAGSLARLTETFSFKSDGTLFFFSAQLLRQGLTRLALAAFILPEREESLHDTFTLSYRTALR
ncbi:hypothetical protein [Cupriavidus consociatus]|uniref:hypothetical protein n=1 Tax=Cupriavidus consociatus TaxID=2821357 RepID=UPI001AEA40C6|nr:MULTISPECIES: hypothetical protein [unclassified Cupriavidus]MBP0621195.1 hypothetical protein [Cupriavidus sp. LEh25]MDK2657866.1 hypothetical protein [Cupriavidus sp. LEh21]